MPDLHAGDPGSPVLLHVPHGGTAIPSGVRDHLLLDDDALAAEIAALTDHRTGELALAAAGAARVRPWAVVNPVSRFVVDPERFPDEREEMAAVGMAAVYTHGTRRQRIRADDPAHRDLLLRTYYEPWAARVEALVAERLAACGTAVLVDVHSYPRDPLPYELHADGPRPPVCLGVDGFHTPAWLVDAAREAFAGVGEVAVNSPFAGTYVPLRHYGEDADVHAIMIELRRDTHLRGTDLSAGAAAVVAALTALVDGV